MGGNGGFKEKQFRCPMCGSSFRVEKLSFHEDYEVEYCPFCGNKLNAVNEISNDELLKQIKEKGDL